MKNIFLTAAVTLSLFAAVTYTSCTPDKCKAIACANGSTCNDGTCVCPTGFEGPQCEKTMRDKFLGIYSVLEKGTISQTAQYTASMEPGVKKQDVLIKNFHNNFIESVSAFVEFDSLFIPQQTIDGKWQVKGSGRIEEDKYYGENGKLTIWYVVRDLTVSESVPPDDYGTKEGEASIWNK